MFRRRINGLALALLAIGPLAYSQPRNTDQLTKVRQQIKAQKYEIAESLLWPIVSADPTNSKALLLLGDVRLGQKRYPEAEALFRRVLQLDSPNREAVRKLASSLLLQNRLSDAAQFLEEAVAEPGGDLSLRIELAQVYVRQSDYPKAASIFQRVSRSAIPAEAIPSLAAAMLGSGDRTGIEELPSRLDGNKEATLELAQVLIKFKEPSLAIDTLLKIPTSSRKEARVLYLKGTAEAMLGHAESAIASLNESLRIDPKYAPSLRALGEIYAARKQFPQAVSHLERAQEADPELLPVYRELIEVSMASGLHGLAEKYAFELEKRSSAPGDLYLSATALLQEREYESAERIFKAYLVHDPDDAKAHLGLGLSLLNEQKFPEAQSELERAIAIDSTLIEAEYSLGVTALKEGNQQKALEHFQHVLKVQPQHAAALLDSGTIYLQEGDLQKAKESLEASELADPEVPDTHYQLSLLYKRLGNADEARQQMDKFQSMKQAARNKGKAPAISQP